ncbi:MAG TPA: sulfatase-like hydrolase/transferase [Anaerolineales bacterium]
MYRFSRRDFFKLSALIPISAIASPWVKNFVSPKLISQDNSPTNIIIILFDAMSARNLSVYGYPRNTTPNLLRFASRANVYHSHNSAGNFTVPGTTSLLTGLYPWTHRAINEAGLMVREFIERNIFRSFGGPYQRLAFAQNLFARFILDQFNKDIDIYLSPESFSLANGIAGSWFAHDLPSSYRSFDDFLFKFDKESSKPASASLVFGTIQRLFFLRQVADAKNTYSQEFPLGLPGDDNYPIYYRLEDVFDGLISTVKKIKIPTIAYFHLFPPHEPYRPSQEFFVKFFDDYLPPTKPEHSLSHGISQNDLNGHRRRYDEYIAYADSQFGRLLDVLGQSGFLENSIVVVTGDHGELFERGEQGHATPLLYDPVIHIPLLISTPGQNNRNDIHDPTNSVDVLPTLLHLANQPVPNWSEGTLLPGLGGTYDPQRSTFSIDAKLNPAFAPFKIATIAMRKGAYKLIHYLGYGGEYEDAYELYNLERDIEEMNNLYASETAIALQMKAELLESLYIVNSHFKS